jgi:hypothetical protein
VSDAAVWHIVRDVAATTPRVMTSTGPVLTSSVAAIARDMGIAPIAEDVAAYGPAVALDHALSARGAATIGTALCCGLRWRSRRAAGAG